MKSNNGKRSFTVWRATIFALILIAIPAYLKWRREYGPPTPETLQVRAFLKDVNEVRVYTSGICATNACIARMSKPLFVLRGSEVTTLVSAIDYFPKTSKPTVFNCGELGDRVFVFMKGKNALCKMHFIISKKRLADVYSGDSMNRFGGACRKRMNADFYDVLVRHNALQFYPQ